MGKGKNLQVKIYVVKEVIIVESLEDRVTRIFVVKEKQSWNFKIEWKIDEERDFYIKVQSIQSCLIFEGWEKVDVVGSRVGKIVRGRN